jgi:hypothetical protein
MPKMIRVNACTNTKHFEMQIWILQEVDGRSYEKFMVDAS